MNELETDLKANDVGLFAVFFERQVHQSGKEVALEFEGTTWTYDEVNRRANQIARFLIEHSLQREDRIGICMDRSAMAIISMIGILKSGCAFVPLDPEFPKDRLAFIVDDASIQMIFCDAGYRYLFGTSAGGGPIFVDPEEDSIEAFEDSDVGLFVPEESLAYVMYTSGSTGKPKGVQIEHRSLMTYCLADIEIYHLRASDRTLQFSTLNFDIAIEEIFPPLLVGSVVVVRPRERAGTSNELSHLIETHRITALHIATAYWHEWVDLLVASKSKIPSSLRLLIATGEKVSVEHFRRWKRQCQHEVLWCNAYGPTETTVTCTVFIPTDTWDEPQMPIGKPLLGYDAEILNDRFDPVAVGETGNLFIGGRALARGYLNRPDLTEKAFLDVLLKGSKKTTRLYRTGDLARWLPSGDIEFSGRVDHQMKIGSYRIEPGEIEAVMALCEAVSESLVICAESDGLKVLAAYVVRKETTPSATEIAAFLRERLPVYMVPTRFIFIDSFPKTINGKIDRVALPPVNSGEVDRQGEIQQPETELEREMAAIWSRVLNVSPIGRDDDFFQLGGSSLLVTRVISQLTDRLDLSIPVRDFFANPTIASLCQHLSSLASVDEPVASETERLCPKTRSRELRQKLPPICPMTIVSGTEQLFAVRYPAMTTAPQRHHSVVVCNAMGHEATRSFRNLQQLAVRLSQEGFDVIRFDYAFTGNSTGPSEQANLRQWRSDMKAVVDRVRNDPKAGNCRHSLSVVGIRLGATLLAQTELAGVDQVILWDPIFSGREYLEQLRSQHRFELESLTRYLSIRKGEPDQLLGCPCSQLMQNEIAAIELQDTIALHARSRTIVMSQDESIGEPIRAKFSDWEIIPCSDEIYWRSQEYLQSAFSSPHIIESIVCQLIAEAV